MTDVQKKRRAESLKSGEYSNLIRKRLLDVNIKLTTKTEGIPTDLGDIQEICNKYLDSIKMLLSNKTQYDKELIIEILNCIYNDLYIHLDYHLKELKKPLNMIIKELESD